MNKKMIVLLMMLSMMVGCLFTLLIVGPSSDVATPNEVKASVQVKKEEPSLKNVEYIGAVDESCYQMACSGYLKFQDGDNIYQLKGHKHELDSIVKGSYYDVYYDDFSKKITRYEFAKKE